MFLFLLWALIIYNLVYFSMTDRFEDTKGVIRIRKSKKDRQHNGHKKQNKQ